MNAEQDEASLVVLSRPGCHLCEAFIEALLPKVRGRIEVAVRDVDANRRWRETYGNDIPVLLYGGREVCRHELDAAALEALLGDRG